MPCRPADDLIAVQERGRHRRTCRAGRWTPSSLRSRRNCFTRLTGRPSRSATSGTVSQSPTMASVGGSICATSPNFPHQPSAKHLVTIDCPQGPPQPATVSRTGICGSASRAGSTGAPGADDPAALEQVARQADGQQRDQAIAGQPGRRPLAGAAGSPAPHQAGRRRRDSRRTAPSARTARTRSTAPGRRPRCRRAMLAAATSGRVQRHVPVLEPQPAAVAARLERGAVADREHPRHRGAQLAVHGRSRCPARCPSPPARTPPGGRRRR